MLTNTLPTQSGKIATKDRPLISWHLTDFWVVQTDGFRKGLKTFVAMVVYVTETQRMDLPIVYNTKRSSIYEEMKLPLLIFLLFSKQLLAMLASFARYQ